MNWKAVYIWERGVNMGSHQWDIDNGAKKKGLLPNVSKGKSRRCKTVL